MEEFVIFKTEGLRKEFFDEIKNSLGTSWKNLAKEIKVSRNSLERYKKEKYKIRKDVFYRLLNYLSPARKEVFLREIKIIDSVSWLSEGGKKAYKINFEKFKEGRKKGLLAIKNNERIRSKKIKEVIINFELTKDLCEVIGAFIGDGFFNCYKNKLYQIEFAGDSRSDLNYYKEKIIPTLKLFIPNLKPHIYFVKNKNSIRIVFYSKELFYFLKDGFGFVPGRKTFTVVIPKIILDSRNNHFINSTIRGIFDTDGCIFFDRRKIYTKPYPRICLQISSKLLIVQLIDYLSKDFKIRSGKVNNRDIHFMEIYGHSQFKKWMSIIGFSNPRHLDRIASVA